VGSDFTYEDIGGREFDEYTYSLVDENASWTAPSGGGARPAWRLESRRKDAAAQFPRVVSTVLKDSFVVVGADIYNRRNEKQKVYTVRRLEQVEADFAARHQALEQEMRAANVRLAKAIQAEHGYGPEVTLAIDHSHQVMGSLQKETLQHLFAMREVLGPEQAEVFDSIVVKALTADAR